MNLILSLLALAMSLLALRVLYKETIAERIFINKVRANHKIWIKK